MNLVKYSGSRNTPARLAQARPQVYECQVVCRSICSSSQSMLHWPVPTFKSGKVYRSSRSMCSSIQTNLSQQLGIAATMSERVLDQSGTMQHYGVTGMQKKCTDTVGPYSLSPVQFRLQAPLAHPR